jgi:hypothetical protein
MLFLDVLTILCAGLMIGNELAVSLFVNPVIWKLEDRSQAKALSLFAGTLGKVMPLWYALCLVLMVVEAYLRRHQPGLTLLLMAVAIALPAWQVHCPRDGGKSIKGGTRITVGESCRS